MRLSSEPPEEVKLNMTAMIDIVFQLLVFFIMTFKVVALEGDFNVKMPLASNTQNESMEDVPEIIYVTLTAGANGNINNIAVDDEVAYSDRNKMFKQLTEYVEGKIAAEGDPEKALDTEVEFEISPELKYRYTVEGIGAVSGRVNPDGTVKKLIQKIKFKDTSS